MSTVRKIVNDEGLHIAELPNLISESTNQAMVFIIDKTVIISSEYFMFVVEVFDKTGEKLHVVLNQMWAVENNLSIANMDLKCFADNLETNGVFGRC